MFLMNSFKVSSIQANALKGLHLQTIMEDFYRSIKLPFNQTIKKRNHLHLAGHL